VIVFPDEGSEELRRISRLGSSTGGVASFEEWLLSSSSPREMREGALPSLSSSLVDRDTFIDKNGLGRKMGTISSRFPLGGYGLKHLHIAFIFVHSSTRYGSQRMFLCGIFVNMEMGTGYVCVGRSLSLNDTNDELVIGKLVLHSLLFYSHSCLRYARK
jgi:hypothetical protein